MAPSQAVFLVRHGDSKTAFELRDFECPSPGSDEVVIEVEYSGLNFADVLARLGLYPEAPKPPSVLGYEVVGRIESVGEKVKNFKAGQRVLAFTRFGGYASRVVTNSVVVTSIPENLDGAQACALATQYVTAYYAAEDAKTAAK